MRILPTSVHAVVDYLVGILLIAAPWLLGFANGGPAQIVPVALGIAVILYSLLTAYELGLWPVIPMSGHLALDAAGGIFLAASPWLFQFSDVIWWPHVVVGVGEVLAAVLTETAPRHVRSTIASGRHPAPRT
ncbi:MAG: hypothetical protein AB7F89_16655 [Pirellulaceae bacterium]